MQFDVKFLLVLRINYWHTALIKDLVYVTQNLKEKKKSWQVGI